MKHVLITVILAALAAGCTKAPVADSDAAVDAVDVDAADLPDAVTVADAATVVDAAADATGADQ
jgi:hypothetical protein